MELNELQKKVSNFEEIHDLKTTPDIRVLDLLSELGEVAKEVCRCSNYGKGKLELEQTIWEMELGDVLFGVIALANATQVNLEKALNATISKMEMRIAAKGHPGSE